MTAALTKRSFKCQRCGRCCRWSGHVLLANADISRLAAATGLTEEMFIEQYTALATNRRQLSLTEHPDGCCVLLTDEGCAFYEARPAQCRTFPHTWRVSEGCPALEAMDKSELKC